MRSPIKYWTRQVHLWLGLASGLVVLIVSLTGCLFVFQKEVSEFLYRDAYFVRPVAGPVLPVSVLQQRAQHVLGAGLPVDNIITYRQPDRAWEFMAYRYNDSAITYFGAVDYFQSVLIDPYTGVVTGTRDYKRDFFVIVKYIHWSLLLNTRYGQPIVGWSTLVFALLLITGLVLWWPGKWTKAYKDRSFRIKWRAGFKRVNYDLHNVPGFYSLLPALVLALTGMVFSFKWFSTAVYVAASGTTAAPPQADVRSVKPVVTVMDTVCATGVTEGPLDRAFRSALLQLPDARRIGITPAFGPQGTIAMYGFRGKETYYGFDALQFDQYTGKLLYRRNDVSKNRGERLIEMNYDIHVGAIGGLAGKIIAFIVSLICASLPVTGFLVWWGKRKKPGVAPAARAKA